MLQLSKPTNAVQYINQGEYRSPVIELSSWIIWASCYQTETVDIEFFAREVKHKTYYQIYCWNSLSFPFVSLFVSPFLHNSAQVSAREDTVRHLPGPVNKEVCGPSCSVIWWCFGPQPCCWNLAGNFISGLKKERKRRRWCKEMKTCLVVVALVKSGVKRIDGWHLKHILKHWEGFWFLLNILLHGLLMRPVSSAFRYRKGDCMTSPMY